MANVHLDLTFNRKSSDVEKLKELRNKVRNGTATDKEKSYWLGSTIGAYNYLDLNRIGEVIKYIAGVLNKYSYENEIGSLLHTDWQLGDIPSTMGISLFWSYLRQINVKFPYYSKAEEKIPDSYDNLTFSEANDLEEFLYIIHEIIQGMERRFVRSGVASCGQNRIWQQGFRIYGDSLKQWSELTEVYWSDFRDAQIWYFVIYD